MPKMTGQHRVSHRLSQVRARRAALIFRSIPALVSSAMLTAIIAQIGKIMPSEIDHIVKIGNLNLSLAITLAGPVQ